MNVVRYSTNWYLIYYLMMITMPLYVYFSPSPINLYSTVPPSLWTSANSPNLNTTYTCFTYTFTDPSSKMRYERDLFLFFTELLANAMAVVIHETNTLKLMAHSDDIWRLSPSFTVYAMLPPNTNAPPTDWQLPNASPRILFLDNIPLNSQYAIPEGVRVSEHIQITKL